MKKYLWLLLIFASCKAEKPLFKPGDLVYHKKFFMYFTIDSLHKRRNCNHVFYYATRKDGVKYPWLSQLDLDKYWRKRFGQ